METIKAVVSMILTVVVVGGLYIGSAIFGYFLAALTILLTILGIAGGMLGLVYLGIRSLMGHKKQKTLY